MKKRLADRRAPVLLAWGISLIAAFLIGTSIDPGRAGATEYVLEDATWWASVSEDERADVIAGILTGFAGGEDDAGAYAMRVVDAEDSAGHLPADEATRITSDVMHYNPTFSKLFSDYNDEISRFYQDNPSASSVTVGTIMECLTDHPHFSCSALIH